MADITVEVTPAMSEFIQWVYSKGEKEIMNMIHDRLLALKEHDRKNPGMPDSNGFRWNDILDPNDRPEQWKVGGDCNRCRKIGYCMTKCRANQLLKKITTPFLYYAYIDEHPEVVAKEAKRSITPQDILRWVNNQ